jgi:hypothetical protein
MPRLNQIIALVGGEKPRAQSEITQLAHVVQKPDLFNGMSRSYDPRDEEGEKLPSEEFHVRHRVSEATDRATTAWTKLWDLVACQDQTNCSPGARASVAVNGTVLLQDVPAVYLIFLEKQLAEVHSFVSKLPTLDPTKQWQFSDEADSWRTAPTTKTRTKKVPRNHIKAPATDHHPAQVEVYHEDMIVGDWTTVEFSGAIPEAQKREYLTRIRQLIDAVKVAREEANGCDVVEAQTGKVLFDYIFSE